jgi:hypothetical protein
MGSFPENLHEVTRENIQNVPFCRMSAEAGDAIARTKTNVNPLRNRAVSAIFTMLFGRLAGQAVPSPDRRAGWLPVIGSAIASFRGLDSRIIKSLS